MTQSAGPKAGVQSALRTPCWGPLRVDGLRACLASRVKRLLGMEAGTYSSVIMSPWGCFMCLAMAASASSTNSSFSESDTLCRATSRCSGC